MRSYYYARHGKAKADGAIGHLSMHIDAVANLECVAIGSVTTLKSVIYCAMTQHLVKLSKAHGVSTLYAMLVFLE